MTQDLWKTINSESVLDHPYVSVEMEEVRLPDSRVISDWPKIHAGDFVNIFVVNENDQALVLDGYKHGVGRSSWQLIGGYLENGENPFAAAERQLRSETGYDCEEWRYLGSFIVDANRHIGIAHFFLAFNARRVHVAQPKNIENSVLRWIPLQELKYALWDGRIAGMSYATNISLGLLALEDVKKQRQKRL